jgi:hypothetical protein
MISTPEKDFSSNKSSSPVTSNWLRYATAAHRIGLSSWSRKSDEISPTSSLSKEMETSFETSSFACFFGSLEFGQQLFAHFSTDEWSDNRRARRSR